MILELEQTFGGLLRISPLPLYSALSILRDSAAHRVSRYRCRRDSRGGL